MIYTIEISEEERQIALLAFAHLAVERPGWDFALSQLALKMDNRTAGGRPELFDYFKKLRQSPLSP